jgi:hypothetical protein
MARELPPQPAGRAVCGSESSWVRLARIARLGLGGSIIGAFLGVYLGAAGGLVGAAWLSRLAPVLDGALLAGVVAAVIGGGYGIFLGVTEPPVARPADTPRLSPSAGSDRMKLIRQGPPAGRLESTHSPEKEQTHG